MAIRPRTVGVASAVALVMGVPIASRMAAADTTANPAVPSSSVTTTAAQIGTRTILTVPATISAGHPFDVSAKVTRADGSPVTAGVVNFTWQDFFSGKQYPVKTAVPVVNGVAHVPDMVINGGLAGDHNDGALDASFANGDPSELARSESGFTRVTVEKGDTKVTVVAPGGTHTVGESVHLTADVEPRSAIRSGAVVQFFDNGAPIDGAQKVGEDAEHHGVFYYAYTVTTPGAHHITARFPETGNLKASPMSAVASFTVDGPGSGGDSSHSAAIVVRRSPVLSGRGRVGSTLTVSHGVYRPASSRVSYTWLRDGRVIGSGVNHYRLTRADRGHKISVEATIAAAGHHTVKRTTNSITAR